VRAAGEGWAMSVSATARPRRLPAWVRLSCAQVRPDGGVDTGAIDMRGWARVGSVRVEHGEPSSLASWLVEGRHPAVFLSGAQTANAPR
jgi:hypothetical protein